MKKVLLVLLLAPMAHAKSAICASENSANYNVQFTWDEQGRLTSAALFKATASGDRAVFNFECARDTKEFAIEPGSALVELQAPTGEYVKIDTTIDSHGVGAGKGNAGLDWKIPSEKFAESGAKPMCSF